MRLAVVSPHLPTPAFPMRGVRHSEQLRLFAAAGHHVQAVVPISWARRDAPREERDGVVIVAHPRYLSFPIGARRQRPGWAAGTLLAAERYFFSRAAASRIDRADVVLTHSVTFPGGLLGLIGRAPLVVTLHDHELYELAPRSKFVARLIEHSLRGADCVVYESEALRQVGLALIGAHESRVIPIGIDTFDDVSRSAPSEFTICCASRLVPRKNVDRLLRVFARLTVEVPDARLVVVGDGPERDRLGSLARALRVDRQVAFRGSLDRRGTMEQIAHSSVMALPSVMESLGAVYLEAMSLGVPALGTAGEGIAAYIAHGRDGVLVRPNDDHHLFDELRALALDPERARRIGEAGRRRFLADGPSWTANVKAHLALFEDLTKARTASPRGSTPSTPI